MACALLPFRISLLQQICHTAGGDCVFIYFLKYPYMTFYRSLIPNIRWLFDIT